jgi:hypothetical protein
MKSNKNLNFKNPESVLSRYNEADCPKKKKSLGSKEAYSKR